ncbi:MAG: hypothetical protein HZB17_15650 [Chloroflexi bacterium]|nr:hypothetical protein [Chloroflexota bacterium]
MSPARIYQSREVVMQEIRRGNVCAILVEGEEQGSDASLLKYILRSTTSEVAFFGRDGRARVSDELREMVRQLPAESVFAILDRDFEGSQTVEQCFAPNYRGHRFIWRRCAIENYLLEPAWIAEAIGEFYALRPDRIPELLQTANAVQQFLLHWAKMLLPQVAGNAVIADLSKQIEDRGLSIAGRSYFDEIFERDSDYIKSRLLAHYSAYSNLAGDLLSTNSIVQRYEHYLEVMALSTANLATAHQVISGKLLLKALYHQLSDQEKPRREYIIGKLATLASKSVPEDIRFLIQDRLLPRWREARRLAQQ